MERGGPPPAYPQDEVKQIERLTEGFEEFGAGRCCSGIGPPCRK